MKQKELTPLKLLQKVKAAILKEPKQFVMGNWYKERPDSDMEYDTIPNCGTAACIGGWAVAIAAGVNPREASNIDVDIECQAIKLLGFEKALPFKNDLTDSLFYTDTWPLEMRRAWETTPTTTGRAKLAARRIDQFIKENKSHFYPKK